MKRAGTEVTTTPLLQPQASTRHTSDVWEADTCPSLSKFIVDLTQGLGGPGSQHRDLSLSWKVLSLLALQTVRVRDLLGKWQGVPSAPFIPRASPNQTGLR